MTKNETNDRQSLLQQSLDNMSIDVIASDGISELYQGGCMYEYRLVRYPNVGLWQVQSKRHDGDEWRTGSFTFYTKWAATRHARRLNKLLELSKKEPEIIHLGDLS